MLTIWDMKSTQKVWGGEARDRESGSYAGEEIS
jgi:hypothetical protein